MHHENKRISTSVNIYTSRYYLAFVPFRVMFRVMFRGMSRVMSRVMFRVIFRVIFRGMFHVECCFFSPK